MGLWELWHALTLGLLRSSASYASRGEPAHNRHVCATSTPCFFFFFPTFGYPWMFGEMAYMNAMKVYLHMSCFTIACLVHVQ